MSVKTIPQAFEYSCDVCGRQHVQENACGHYTNSRPPRWGHLTIKRDGPEDYQGQVWSDGNISVLLCDSCLPGVEKVVNRWAADHKGTGI